MNNFYSLYNNITKESKISLINEQNIINELKIRLITEGITPNEEDLIEVSKACVELYEDRHWAMALGWHLFGALDPTGAVDLGHAIWYFNNDQVLAGILTLIGVIPYAGDTAKILIPVVKGTKTGMPMLQSGLRAGFRLSNARVSAAKFLLQRLPRLEKGLSWIVSKMVQSPTMKRILVKKFGGASTKMGKVIAKQGVKVTRQMRYGVPSSATRVDTTQIVEPIVKKMLSMIDKPLRIIAGPKMHQSVKGALAASGVKTAAYNVDTSEIPYLKKFNMAPDKNIQRNKDSQAIQDYISKHYIRPETPSTTPKPSQAVPQRRKIDLGAY